ncbi:cyclic AMP-dependent transcription factor ATF-3-like isoform X1 [Denticeps clupeoides]|uniref:cyclic AMP-dependent transcription factor ATF-3-like isoform X1 n=1 Tax=Denticeps clupeoides TaxID=299321 RepID=UPI0010A498E4|nr:cyclic AMP-dependent transcription factor ATF-3 isoform X1 [Denticeps clupeoides]
MMLQHLVPCLSPPGSLTLDDFADFAGLAAGPAAKEELRQAIQHKRRGDMSGDTARQFTPEESERKRRRRERNKIAAAKCRNKKKEKTDGLQKVRTRSGERRDGAGQVLTGPRFPPRKESEKLESINAELKAQIEELKNQKQQLVYMLNLHRPTCIVRAQNGQTPEDERNLFIQQIRESALQELGLGLPASCGHHGAPA